MLQSIQKAIRETGNEMNTFCLNISNSLAVHTAKCAPAGPLQPNDNEFMSNTKSSIVTTLTGERWNYWNSGTNFKKKEKSFSFYHD